MIDTCVSIYFAKKCIVCRMNILTFSFLLYSFWVMKMESELKELILNNENLIYSVIHKFRSKDYDDLYQAGCVGLIKAYKNFKNNLNVKFTSYAYNYILGEIYSYLINNRTIHLSPMNIKLLNSINKARDVLTNHLGRSPTTTELCAFCEIDLKKYIELQNMMTIDSLDYEYNSIDLYNFVANETLSKDILIDLKNALNSLTKDEKRLINARYFNNYTQSQLAKKYNTNQVKISREEKKILNKLKAKMY